ncbi:MAG: NUDIX hydrolase [Methylicorpusculum sp.]|uniref:NUDIX hydrolase n=1 Tax=Methylicorpusculum sp. TaxID=2713644 RepID=UPI0027233FCA|nr:NUDIX hydrolase [Methylicorpusculum sp.]MDO8845868.1 NUDIX hydrolase [Methylicorpusculum sp.]MDO8939327.1 NUDIX hydrolase [Methylicorpusculum sp.]MDP2180928.1 NUDIX hydrolase [Methylicorpusculum sp.]MDP2201687.1 NUDIX hydrolase [Methylicorpusculum sp.]MDP3528840.1 NUDIX hydrolase [Methylicorpusculum sp.]
MVWKPHVTVAAIVEEDNRFLLVEEETSKGLAFNQPAGHLEKGEDLIAAVKREVHEETGWLFEPENLVAVQLWSRNSDYPTFLRVCFSGKVHSFDPSATLDDGIVATHWLTKAELEKLGRLRSPLVMICIDEYLQGQKFPLSITQNFLDLDL